MKLCVVWQRFGPYHHARLRACAELFGAHNGEVIGVQVAGLGGVHRWAQRSTDAELVTLFPDAAVESLSHRRVFRSMRRLLDQIEPDAVAVPAYSRPESQACVAWARACRRVAVVMAESRREDARRSPIRERIKRAIVSQFDAALAGGTPQVRYIHELGISLERIFMPYDVVDNDFFAEGAAGARSDPAGSRARLGLDSTRPFFLAAGRLIQRKNFGNLLSAYGQYLVSCRDREPWDLVIVGDGPERQRLSASAAALNLPGHVTFAGYRQADQLAAYYGLASVFIHPARVEQWGLVVNEAMAAGLPVLVSSGVGAAEDLVTDRVNGYVFHPTDAGGLKDAMCRISAPEAELERMGAASRARIGAWRPECFAEGLWNSVAAGTDHAGRPMPLSLRVLLFANQMMPSSALAWRSVEQ